MTRFDFMKRYLRCLPRSVPPAVAQLFLVRLMSARSQSRIGGCDSSGRDMGCDVLHCAGSIHRLSYPMVRGIPARHCSASTYRVGHRRTQVVSEFSGHWRLGLTRCVADLCRMVRDSFE